MKKINILTIFLLFLFSIEFGNSLCSISSSYPYHNMSAKDGVNMILAM
ncbi:hypothetical protein [Francisella sp. 19X1-34]|nr:hypothetical protein [Francisella sp. 19X1-34]MED7789558.1 hypothetical protein [Francisella sp. 19X1-34]